MLRLTVYELARIWKKRSFLILFAIILIFNTFLNWYTNLSDGSDPELSAYKALAKDLAPMTEEEKKEYIETLYQEIQEILVVQNILSFQSLSGEMGKILSEQEMAAHPGVFEQYHKAFEDGSYLRYTDSLDQETALIEEAYAEMTTVFSYPEYLEEIKNNKDRLSGISIFSSTQNQENFSSRNIEKSAKDYSHLEHVKTVFFPSKGFTCAMQNHISDILLLLSALLSAGSLIYEEKEKKLFFITRAAVFGRGKSIAAKLASLGIDCIGMTGAVYLVNLLFFAGTAGIGSLGANIQSLAPFTAGTLPISSLTYILLSIITKAAVIFIPSVLTVCIFILSKQSFLPYLTALAFLIGNLLFYQLIPAWSSWNWMKYLNIFGLLKTENIYGSYLNFNFFEYPVSRTVSSVVVLIVCILTGSLAAGLLFIKKRNFEVKKLRLPVFSALRPHSSLFFHESYKILIMNRSAIVFLIFFLLIGHLHLSAQYRVSAKETYYQNLMLELEGELTPEKEAMIEAENERYQKAFEQIARIEAMVASGEIEEKNAETMKSVYYSETAFYPFFQRVLREYNSIKDNGGRFIYDTGWLYVFGVIENGFLRDLILLSICLILAFGNVMAMEQQKKSWFLLSATICGKRAVIQKKLLACILFTLPAGLLPCVFRMIQINGFYPLHELSASLCNIPAFQRTGISVPVVVWVFATILVQEIALMLVCFAVLWLSWKLKGYLQTVFVAMLIFVIPPVLYEMGFEFARWATLMPIYGMASLGIG